MGGNLCNFSVELENIYTDEQTPGMRFTGNATVITGKPDKKCFPPRIATGTLLYSPIANTFRSMWTLRGKENKWKIKRIFLS